jgi:hypothetical protein|tara:strand:- start:2379 stop:2927 length:549 start_codon:yes stop_codon:yes gene_type:complete
MACDLTIGRKEPCKDVVGGIKAVYFFNFGTITAAFDGTDVDVIDDLGTVTAFEYEVKGNSSFEQTINASRENGTAFFEQTLNLTLHKLTVQDHKELKLLTYGRPHVVVQDYNNNAFMMGLEHGADVSGGTIVTGAAMGDLSGYTLTLTAQEVKPANFLEGATSANPFAGLTGTVTITQGTNS